MIYVAAVDINAFSDGELKINETVKKRIEKSASESEKKLRAAAYHAMFLLLERFFDDGCCPKQNLELRYTGEGKPYFDKPNDDNNGLQNVPSISISHDKLVAVAAISDSKTVGVDVQGASIPKRRMERVAARFFAPVNKTEKISNGIDDDIKLFFVNGENLLDISEGFSVKESDSEKETFDFLAKWTRLEAVMKAEGGGFSEYPSIEELLLSYKTKTFVLTKDKDEYVITIAK